DYVAWRNSLGQTGLGLTADGNLNNQIDSGDFSFWRSHFGQNVSGGAGLAASAANIPEPSSGLLLFTGLLGVFGHSWRTPRLLHIGVKDSDDRDRFGTLLHLWDSTAMVRPFAPKPPFRR